MVEVRIANWLLGDHLGSTSMVADASGTVVSEMRYSAFGEIRYQNGTLTTDYLYTGQRQEAEIGLYYYVARWYDPAIGRFIQADSVLPNSLSPLTYDRYAYSYNSPCNFTDPSGHCGVSSSLLFPNHGPENFFALSADCRGIEIAIANVDQGKIIGGTHSTAVAAAIATQSNWYIKSLDTHGGLLDRLNPSKSSGYGIAQIGDEEMVYYGLVGENQDDNSIAVYAMGRKIDYIMKKFETRVGGADNLSPRDRLIIAALAQNSTFGNRRDGTYYPDFGINDVRVEDNRLDWGKYWDRPHGTGGLIAGFRSRVTGMDYRSISVAMYSQNLLELNRRGWELPYDLTPEILNQVIVEAFNNFGLAQ